MNISPGQRIIIRNEIAAESLIGRCSTNIATGFQDARARKVDDTDFFPNFSIFTRVKKYCYLEAIDERR